MREKLGHVNKICAWVCEKCDAECFQAKKKMKQRAIRCRDWYLEKVVHVQLSNKTLEFVVLEVLQKDVFLKQLDVFHNERVGVSFSRPRNNKVSLKHRHASTVKLRDKKTSGTTAAATPATATLQRGHSRIFWTDDGEGELSTKL